jgi:hypothetical protein
MLSTFRWPRPSSCRSRTEPPVSGSCSVLWLNLDPTPVVACGRILPLSGAWAGPRKEAIPHDSQKSAANEDKHLFFTHLLFLWVLGRRGGANSSRVKPFAHSGKPASKDSKVPAADGSCSSRWELAFFWCAFATWRCENTGEKGSAEPPPSRLAPPGAVVGQGDRGWVGTPRRAPGPRPPWSHVICGRPCSKSQGLTKRD